jgi:S-adenosylmethionine/arginine decarboxylase-like enzyme
MSDYWGYHLMLDFSGCDHDKITDGENIKNFTIELVKRIDMVAYGEPIVTHFATHDPEKAGYSMMQLIETSNLSAHFVDRDNTGYLDVFSCKPYDLDIVVNSVKEFFGASKVRINYLTRHAG